MGLRKMGFMLVAVGMILSCTQTLQRPTSSAVPVIDVGVSIAQLLESYQGNEVSFLYTEGIKAGLLTNDTAIPANFFRRVLEIDPTHAPSLYELAGLYADDPQTAIQYSYRANALDTANIWYKTQLGMMLIGNHQYDSALNVYNNLLKLSPDNPDIYVRLAALYDHQGQPFTAISILDSAETRFGLMEELASYKRQLLINVNLYDKALQEANTLAANFPYDEENWLAIGELYAAMGRDSLAMDAFQRAQSINPNSVEVLATLNEYYKQKNDNVNFLLTTKQLLLSEDIPLDNKIRFYNEIVKNRNFYREYFFQINDIISSLAIKYPAEYRVTELYATHLISSGNLDEALKLYKSNLIHPRPNQKAFDEVLNIEAYLNRPDSVSKYSNLALEYFPDNVDLYIRKGAVLSFFLKDYKGAEEAYLEGLKHAETDSLKSVLYGSLGDNRQASGDAKNSFKYYRLALKHDTTNAVVYNNFSYYLSEMEQQLYLAEQMAVQANRLSPNNPTYMDTQAWVYYKQGRYEEAKALIQQAVALDTSSSEELFLHYGDILYALKDYFMASFYWKKAEEQGYDAEEIAKRLQTIPSP